MEIADNNIKCLNILTKVKANLYNIFHFLTPSEELYLLRDLKCKLILNYFKAYDFQELISLIIRSSLYGSKYNKSKPQKSKTKKDLALINYDYIFHIFSNKLNLSQVFTSMVIHKPFLIPFNIYKSIGGRIDDLSKSFTSKIPYHLENKNVDVYLISNSEGFSIFFTDFTKEIFNKIVVSQSPDNENCFKIFKQNTNYFQDLEQNQGMEKIMRIYNNLDKSKKITINVTDLRKLYELNEKHDYFLKMNMKIAMKQVSNTQNKEDYYDWNEFFKIQKYDNFYNSFFSYEHILINNSDMNLNSAKVVDDSFAIFIHCNGELNTQDKELLDYFSDVTDQRILTSVISKLNINSIKKKSTHLESYIEFDTKFTKENNNLKLLCWVNLKMAGFHFIKLQPLYHHGRFIIIKFINCSTVSSFAFYGHMLEY